ncbi:MAG: hypothetical protein KJ950_03260 [Proteobacteria bacterium]|nr:hypothetical protein [Pseudomonadota bacterium]MBU1686338.1 hypothetical protein [Pseudomonadota bacterium]
MLATATTATDSIYGWLISSENIVSLNPSGGADLTVLMQPINKKKKLRAKYHAIPHFAESRTIHYYADNRLFLDNTLLKRSPFCKKIQSEGWDTTIDKKTEQYSADVIIVFIGK